MQRSLPARCYGEKNIFREKRFLDFGLAVLGAEDQLFFVVVLKLPNCRREDERCNMGIDFLRNDRTADVQFIL
jgi:hypothetical protein